ncbi:MAG TPA: hypothetical protein VEG34_19430 [Thermoanaerobaculia bacterium]|nr:hypothetical protein [Thermoanaerobaculia bacterium]
MEIVVEVGDQTSGATFSLSPKTRTVLRSKSALGPLRVFISNETRDAFERAYGPISPQIVSILTGLPEQEVRRIGYTFVDPVTESVLLEHRDAA